MLNYLFKTALTSKTGHLCRSRVDDDEKYNVVPLIMAGLLYMHFFFFTLVMYEVTHQPSRCGYNLLT